MTVVNVAILQLNVFYHTRPGICYLNIDDRNTRDQQITWKAPGPRECSETEPSRGLTLLGWATTFQKEVVRGLVRGNVLYCTDMLPCLPSPPSPTRTKQRGEMPSSSPRDEDCLIQQRIDRRAQCV